MATEKTLVFVKPDNLEKASEILDCLDDLLNYDFMHSEPIKITQIPENLIIAQRYLHTFSV